MEEKVKSKDFRVHRVGSVTAGAMMISFGVMFLLHSVFHLITYELIFSLWPVIIIGLGIELLLSNLLARKIVYDKAAVFLMIMMAFFAIAMAITDVCLQASATYLFY